MLSIDLDMAGSYSAFGALVASGFFNVAWRLQGSGLVRLKVFKKKANRILSWRSSVAKNLLFSHHPFYLQLALRRRGKSIADVVYPEPALFHPKSDGVPRLSHIEASSLEAARDLLSVDPKRYISTTTAPSDSTATSHLTTGGAKSPHVCVVGAGLAGMRCGRKLAEQGFKVTIFEARNRVGGRVQQIEQSGHDVDVGSNWIHGSKNNPILKIAHELGNVCFEPPEGESAKSPIYDRSGKALDGRTAPAYSAETWDIIDEAIRYSQKDKGASIPPEKSLIDYFTCAMKARNYDETKTKLILEMAQMWSDIVGEPVENQSLRYMWLEECIEGENWFLASTYGAILNRIHEECLARAEIILDKHVIRIRSIRSDNASSQAVLIDTADGMTSTFDEVVITAPLGWLKRNQPAFSPPLSPQVANAISHIGYGRLEKVYVHFPTAFWLSEDSADSNPLFFQFLSPEYAPEQNPQRWTIECVSLASLPEPCNHATLLFYINGPTSEHVTSLVRDDEPGSQTHYQKLDAFFSPYYSRLPNYDAENCKPTSFYNTDWQNDEFAGNGSYSTFQVSDYERDGLVELDKDIEIVRHGCPERNLWFAGEHTAPTLALGTTTGAYWSGEAVAERIARLYGKHETSSTDGELPER